MYQGTQWYSLMKKTEGRKSRDTVSLRAVCQGVILVVANCGIGVRFATTERYPIPAILHRQSPVSSAKSCNARHYK
jgi:hypothetical protein